MAVDLTDEFANADLNDVRRSRRLCKVVAALAQAPGASICAATDGWNETMAVYRLLNSEGFEPGALIAPRQETVVKRCAGHACVVVSQDTTEFDYSHMSALTYHAAVCLKRRNGNRRAPW